MTPEVIRIAYEEYAKANLRPTIWVYRVISIRDKDQSKAEKAAEQAYQYLTTEQIPITLISDKMGALELSTKLNLTEELRHTDKEVSDSYKEPLSKLQPGLYSRPLAIQSRKDNSTVYRIFFLKEKIPGGMIPYSEISPQIKENLLNNAAMKKQTLISSSCANILMCRRLSSTN